MVSMSHKIFENDLAAICKSIVTLTLNKPAYIGTCILYLSKVLMYKSFMVALKINIVTNQHLFTDTGSLMYEI